MTQSLTDAARSGDNKTLICKACGKEFKRRFKVGQIPLYCGKPCNAIAWARNNPHRRKERLRKAMCCGLRNRYGITADEFDIMVEKQGGVCLICGEPPARNGTATSRLHVDHNHETGKIRGLLCSKCNTGLGLFNDSTDLLNKAADYLNRTKRAQT